MYVNRIRFTQICMSGGDLRGFLLDRRSMAKYLAINVACSLSMFACFFSPEPPCLAFVIGSMVLLVLFMTWFFRQGVVLSRKRILLKGVVSREIPLNMVVSGEFVEGFKKRRLLRYVWLPLVADWIILGFLACVYLLFSGIEFFLDFALWFLLFSLHILRFYLPESLVARMGEYLDKGLSYIVFTMAFMALTVVGSYDKMAGIYLFMTGLAFLDFFGNSMWGRYHFAIRLRDGATLVLHSDSVETLEEAAKKVLEGAGGP